MAVAAVWQCSAAPRHATRWRRRMLRDERGSSKEQGEVSKCMGRRERGEACVILHSGETRAAAQAVESRAVSQSGDAAMGCKSASASKAGKSLDVSESLGSIGKDTEANRFPQNENHAKAASSSNLPGYSIVNPESKCTSAHVERELEYFPFDVPALLRRCDDRATLPLGGVLLRGALREHEQRWLWVQMRARAAQSPEVAALEETASDEVQRRLGRRPQQLLSWLHPYSRESSIRVKPAKLLKWAQELMHACAAESRGNQVDSLLAQLYVLGGGLLPHRDEDLSWGVGVSLGATASFECLPEGDGQQPSTLQLKSGDVIIGEFGSLRHAVRVHRGAHVPHWWREEGLRGNTLNRARCNLLFRQALTEQRQRALAEERARKVYGMSVAALQEKTGKPFSELSLHLRHIAQQ